MDFIDLLNNAKSTGRFALDAKERAEDIVNRAKIMEFIEKKKEDDEMKKTILTVLSIIGAIAAIAGIAYAVYKFVTPDDFLDDDYEEDDDYDDMDIIQEA